MAKRIILFIASFIVLIPGFASENKILEVKLPEYVQKKLTVLKNSPIFESVNFKVAKNGYKTIMLTGLIEENNLKDINEYPIKLWKNKKDIFCNINNRNYFVISQLMFFDNNNRLIAKRFIPYNISIDLIDSPKKPILVIMKTINHGNYHEKIGFDIYDLKGNLLKTIKSGYEDEIVPSIDSNFICYKEYNTNGFAAQFTIENVEDFVNNNTNKVRKSELYVKKYTVKFHNRSPSHFLLLGGHSVDIITVFDGRISRKSLKNKENIWKINHIGENVLKIAYNKKAQTLNALLINHQHVIIDAITGSVLTTFNPKNIPFVKDYYKTYNIDFQELTFYNNKLKITMISPEYTLIKIHINNWDSKNSKKTIKITKYQPRYKNLSRKVIEKTDNGYYILSVSDSKAVLSFLKEDDLFKKTIETIEIK